MVMQKVVTPVETGVQGDCQYMMALDSGFRRNDGIYPHFQNDARPVEVRSDRTPQRLTVNNSGGPISNLSPAHCDCNRKGEREC
jgi:hypothetical protein